MKKHITPKYYAQLCLVIIAMVILSCSTPKELVYLRDIEPDAAILLQETQLITIKPGDKLNIRVHSRDNELAEMFNINRYGANESMHERSIYTVDPSGNVEIPVIGNVKVSGMTRFDLQNDIKYRLMSSNLLSDPLVTVEFHDMAYYVIGETGTGRHPISRDRITILEALAESGDLSIYGRRDNVLVLRTVDGMQIPYRINLTKTDEVYSSPAFYIQQNDVIYVEPNPTRINQSTPNGNGMRTPAFWISILNFLLSVYIIFSK